jgi:hypothetical protein
MLYGMKVRGHALLRWKIISKLLWDVYLVMDHRCLALSDITGLRAGTHLRGRRHSPNRRFLQLPRASTDPRCP